MNAYQVRKEKAREEAIDWQSYYFGDNSPSMSWYELAEWQERFEELGRRYGLLAEFRDNGII